MTQAPKIRNIWNLTTGRKNWKTHILTAKRTVSDCRTARFWKRLPLYEEYRNGHISRERFIKIQSDNKAEDERLQQKIAEKNVLLNECIQKQKALTLAGQDAERIQALTEYRPEVISRLIDKVRVFEGGRIEIGLKSKYLTDIIGECIPGLAS